MAVDASDALEFALNHAQVRSLRERTGLTIAKSWSRA
jgi:crossover junction endodeoxyribonuclease RuvC